MKKLSFLILVFIVGITQSIAQISISLNTKKKIAKAPSSLYSINFHRGMDDKIAANAMFKNRVNDIDPEMIRYHAAEQIREGNDKSWIDFKTKSWKVSKIKTILQNKSVSDDKVLITISGWPSWMDTNNDKKLDSDKRKMYYDFCAKLVDIINNQLGFNIKYWEPFNEMDGKYQGSDNIKILADIFKGCHNAMKAVDKNIKIVGGAWTQPWDESIDVFLKRLDGKYLDVWSHHQYGKGDETNVQTMYDRANLDRGVDHMRKKLDNNGFNNIPLWLNEWNMYWTWDAKGHQYMTTHIGAVFDALIFKRIAEKGITDALFSWNAADGRYGKIKKDFSGLHPGGHLFKLFSTYGNGDVLDITTSDEKKVQGFSVKNVYRNRQIVTLINRHTNSARVNFSAQGWKPNKDEVTKHVISSSGYNSSRVSWSKDVVGREIETAANSVTIFVSEAKGTGGDTFIDDAISVEGPKKVEAQKRYDVKVTYEASEDRKVSVYLFNTSNWSKHGSASIHVSKGRGSVTIPVMVNYPSIGTDYQWTAKVENRSTGDQLDQVSTWCQVIGSSNPDNPGGSNVYYFYAEAGNDFELDDGRIEKRGMHVTTINSGAPEGNSFIKLTPEKNYAKYQFKIPNGSDKSSWSDATLSFRAKTQDQFDVIFEQKNGTKKSLSLKDYLSNTNAWQEVEIPISDFGIDLTQFSVLTFYRKWKREVSLELDHIRVVNTSRAIKIQEAIGVFPTKVALYPNPVQGEISITTAPNQKSIITMLTINGKQLLRKTMKSSNNGEIKLNLDSFIPDLYFIRIENQDTYKTFKVLKQ